jgi:hypothetical protein
MSYGLVNGAHVATGGVTGVVNGNVFIGGANIGTIQGGSGLEIANTRPGYPTIISNNIFSHSVDKAPDAIKLTFGLGESNSEEAVGLNDLTIETNIVYDWYRGVYVDSGFTPGGTGITAMNKVNVRDNEFQNITDAVLTQKDSINRQQEHWSDNIYSSASAGVVMNQKNMSVSQWTSANENGAKVTQVPYVDPERSLATYDGSLGGLGTTADFLAQVRLQSSQTWQAPYVTETIINYMRAGFERTDASPRDWRAPTPPIAAAVLPATVLDRDTALTFTVTYTDLKSINLSTIASGNVNVTGQGGLNVPATLVGMSSDGASATATYSITAPDRYFRKGAPRKLTAVMNASQVTNSDGFAAVAGPIGTFKLRVLPRPKSPVVRSVKLLKGGTGIAVRFSTDVSASLTPGAVTLQSESGQSVDPASLQLSWDAAHNTATWSLSPDAGGALPAGRWHLTLNAATIADAGGRHLDGNKDGLGGDDYVLTKPLVVSPAKVKKQKTLP